MLSGYGYVFPLPYNGIGLHSSDVYLEMSLIQDGDSYLILACVGKETIQDNGDKLTSLL